MKKSRIINMLLTAALVCGGTVQADEFVSGPTVEVIYGITSDSWDDLELPNTTGLRGSYSVFMQSSPKVTHELALSLAPQWGCKTTSAYYEGVHLSAKLDAFMMPITLGYKPHFSLSEKADLFLSARLGYALVDADIDAVAYSGSSSGRAKMDAGIDGGFVSAIGLGFSFKMGEHSNLIIGYEFQASRLKSDEVDVSDHTFKQHVISCGAVFKF